MNHNDYAVPALILARTALERTLDVLRELYPNSEADDPRKTIEMVHAWGLTDKAVDCLRTACAAGNLTMNVCDPRTGLRHEIPAEYFDQPSMADLEFVRATFGAHESPEIIKFDPLFKLVLPFRGWVHGFVERDFRAWLENHEIGPAAGPQLRPFFHPEHLELATPRKPPSRLKSFWGDGHLAIMEELRENGCPADRDGSQAKLEDFVSKWLIDRGHEASESTIRRHVKSCMSRYRQEVGSLETTDDQ